MISVISVVNDEYILKEWLLRSLSEQTAEYEFIHIENSKNRFPSAAKAYNHGAAMARGDYLMFVHQDVRLLSKTWLEDAEKTLASLPKLGAAGVAGAKNRDGVFTNSIHGIPPRPAGHIRISSPIAVQSLDSMLMITPKKVFNKITFDERVCRGWHLYVEDYCLTLNKYGLESYVIPLEVHHRSTGVKQKRRGVFVHGPLPDEYYKNLSVVLRKHSREFSKIYTTCGNYYTKIPVFVQLSPLVQLLPHFLSKKLKKAVRLLQKSN